MEEVFFSHVKDCAIPFSGQWKIISTSGPNRLPFAAKIEQFPPDEVSCL